MNINAQDLAEAEEVLSVPDYDLALNSTPANVLAKIGDLTSEDVPPPDAHDFFDGVLFPVVTA